MRRRPRWSTLLALALVAATPRETTGQVAANTTITRADCHAEKLGATIPVSSIGEPVAHLTLDAPTWVAATGDAPAYCSVHGAMAPVDTAANAKLINFQVALPASWSHRSVQLGGGGMNGWVPGPWPLMLQRGFATYGSDAGHQGEPLPVASQDWALNDEAIQNLGYMQMKKTHDAAMVLVERMYGAKPRFNFYVGQSQGGREGLMVAQRYPADYDGILAAVPLVDFTSLMLAPVWIRIQEQPLANWVTPTKVNAIHREIMRQCDTLDGLADGIINNYMACRARFDVTRGVPGRDPWSAKRCPNDRDPAPADTASSACLTDGQIATLDFLYRPYEFASPLAHGRTSFGMWLPNTGPSEWETQLTAQYHFEHFTSTRFTGQEGAAEDAPVFAHIGTAGVSGFLMQDLQANPLQYVEGGAFDARRRQLSPWLDATDPDLTAFSQRGGKLIVIVGTNDNMASPGDQLDYFQSVIDTMGHAAVDRFARFFVVPQTDQWLVGVNYPVDGVGTAIPTAAIPTPTFVQQVDWLVDWVERDSPPITPPIISAGERSLPLCSYPGDPRYVDGPPELASSYRCVLR